MSNLGKIRRLKAKRKIPVTIIVGLICERCVILASDSQTTYSSGLGATKRSDTQKISPITFRNGQAIIAQAGDAALSGRAIEILTELAKGKEINDYRSVADLAQVAMRKLKDELRAANCDCTIEQLRSFIDEDDFHFELMIAYYYEKEPQVFTIDFKIGIATKQPKPFTAIGCGSPIASYILSWFEIPKMTVQQCAITAMYAVEEVKQVDPFCGGPTRLAMVAPTREGQSGAKIYPVFARLRAALPRLDQAAKAEWRKEMDKLIAELTKEDDSE